MQKKPPAALGHVGSDLRMLKFWPHPINVITFVFRQEELWTSGHTSPSRPFCQSKGWAVGGWVGLKVAPEEIYTV